MKLTVDIIPSAARRVEVISHAMRCAGLRGYIKVSFDEYVEFLFFRDFHGLSGPVMWDGVEVRR